MRRLMMLWTAFGLALVMPVSAQKPGPPASATFSVDACVDSSTFAVSVTATWSHARVDDIKFSALANGVLLGDQATTGGGARDGSTSLNWLPPLSTATRATNEIVATFTDAKDRWTLVGHAPALPCQ